MSKYKSPIGGSGKRTTNLFYRSGIGSLLSRIEKLEYSVNCCGPMSGKGPDPRSGSETLSRSAYNHETVLWDCGTDDDTLTTWYPQKGDSLTIILNTDGHASGGAITVAGGGQFWGIYSVAFEGDAADEVGYISIPSDATAANFDHILLDANGTVTGGQDGNRIHLYATADGKWHSETTLTTTGTPASIAPVAAARA